MTQGRLRFRFTGQTIVNEMECRVQMLPGVTRAPRQHLVKLTTFLVREGRKKEQRA